MLSLTFCEGLDRSKFTAMRKLFLFILFCSLYTVGYAQINAYDRSSYSKLSLPSFDEMVKVAQNKQQQYDQNAQYIDVLIDWIFDLKQQANDANFNSAMDACYNSLKSFYNKDLSVMGRQIKQVELHIKEAIDNYNNKIQRQQSTSHQNTYSSYRSYSQPQTYHTNYDGQSPVIITKLSCPLRDKPSAASGTSLLWISSQCRLEFLSKEGEYYKTRCGEIVGYINEMFIDI